jgi:hypothetical protein
LFQGKSAAGWPVICLVIGDVELPRVASLKRFVPRAKSLPTPIITANEAIAMSVRIRHAWPMAHSPEDAICLHCPERRESGINPP